MRCCSSGESGFRKMDGAGLAVRGDGGILGTHGGDVDVTASESSGGRWYASPSDLDLLTGAP